MSLGIIATNLMCGDSLVVHSDDPLEKQMAMAFPSAFGTPDATGVKALDLAGVTATTLISFEAARRTTSLGSLAAMGISAQFAGCGADALVDQTGWVENATDSGSSAMGVAWMTKFLLDRIESAEDETKKRRWKIATAAYAGAMTLGAYILLGDDGKLDMVSHGSALVVGAVAYGIDAWRKRRTEVVPLAATELSPELAI
jgi:hypothetical protein